MKRIYSIKDFKYYTMLKQVLIDLELVFTQSFVTLRL